MASLSATSLLNTVPLRLEMAAAAGWKNGGRALPARSTSALAYLSGNCSRGDLSRTRGVMNGLSDWSSRGRVVSVPLYDAHGGTLARSFGVRAQAQGREGGSTGGSQKDARGGDASRAGGAGSTAGAAGSAGGAGSTGQGSGTAGGGAGATSGTGTTGGGGAGTTSGAGTTGRTGTSGAGAGTTGATSGTDLTTRGLGGRGLSRAIDRPGLFGGLAGPLDLWSSPATSVRQMMDLMDRLTDDTFFGRSGVGRLMGDQLRGSTRLPFEWRETDDKFLFRMDIPGVQKDEVKVRVEGENTLVVSADHHRRADEGEHVKDKDRIESEARYFSRISLPDHVKANEIRADFKDGVLHVVIPKEKAPERKVVDISIS
ncbi:hypothetical protein CBR_g49526 [Chara braunii]|uniref:SHSP domain-containing protein n=1 Tax=Chara braunii TaxID=69332 RepID=A0A388M5B3_CHABU|nr:hypothetical protein CBR_g49526 [Chara braunii]|eukprot:GBG89673.1 hypothetical protein CBR_g49526 [Chara braunii]